jgi:hypothetical protein
MEREYKKESPSKKIARKTVYKELETVCGRRRFVNGPHLVIAGSEGGDISVLLGMGVDPQGIYAVDIDKHALAAAKDRFREWGVNFWLGPFSRAAQAFGVDEFLTAFIDMCSELKNTDIAEVMKLRARYKVYAFSMCRDKGLAGTFIKAVDGKTGIAAKPRLEYLRSRGFNWGLAYTYVSRTLTNKGTPMCIAFANNIVRSSAIVHLNWEYADLDRALLSPAKETYLLYNVRRQAAAAKKAWRTRRKRA